MKITVFTITFILISSVASNVASYTCEECLADLDKMTRSYIARMEMARLCNEICSGSSDSGEPSSGSGYGRPPLPGLDLPTTQLENNARVNELTVKINDIMEPYIQEAELHCVMNGQEFGGVADRNCVSLILCQLTKRPNVEKIMHAIGAKSDEYAIVQLLIFDVVYRGY